MVGRRCVLLVDCKILPRSPRSWTSSYIHHRNWSQSYFIMCLLNSCGYLLCFFQCGLWGQTSYYSRRNAYPKWVYQSVVLQLSCISSVLIFKFCMLAFSPLPLDLFHLLTFTMRKMTSKSQSSRFVEIFFSFLIEENLGGLQVHYLPHRFCDHLPRYWALYLLCKTIRQTDQHWRSERVD